MGKIHILDQETVNKIAAGEVVERPASVVKELVENSIDAAARQIEIEFIAAGKKLIKVKDTGYGMDRDDLNQSIHRHATSKIVSLADLYNIRTLGFRGEALPSIAAVCKFTLTSRISGSDTGWQISIQDGKTDFRPSGHPVGTTIEVADLFYNTPARLKFLRSEFTEKEHIVNTVTDLALTHYETAFLLKEKQNTLFSTSSAKDFATRIGELFGVQLFDELFYLEHNESGYQISGFFSRRDKLRPVKMYQFTAVNRRPVRSRVLNQSVYSAYREVTTVSGKYPYFFLYFNLDPATVDVNVHPTKREVKFAEEDKIYRTVQNLIARELRSLVSVPSLVNITTPIKSPQPEKKNIISTAEPIPTAQVTPSLQPIKKEPFVSTVPVKNNVTDKEDLFIPTATKPESKKGLLDLRIIPLSQLGKTYILCQSEDGLVVIDQHAASERIMYEKYKTEVEQSKVVIQQLIEPVLLEFNPVQNEWVKHNLNLFNQLGFEIAPFGDRSYTLRAVPAVLGDRVNQTTVDEIVNFTDYAGVDKSSLNQTVDLRDRVIRASCRTAVKAQDNLSRQEMYQLIESLRKCQFPYSCAHGRPTLVSLTYHDLERLFRRT